MELIISGFAIFLVGSLAEPLLNFQHEIQVISQGVDNNFIISAPYMILLGAWFFLLVNLIFHVILRGFWISTIGLRYVSGDIDFDVLKFHPKFDRFIRKRTLSYDEYIERLEKFCSVVFALTFLIIFMLFAFGMWGVGLFFLIDVFCFKFIKSVWEAAANPLSLILGLFWFLGGLLYLIDFISLGWLKRKKWAAIVYFPVYRLFSFITLAFVYRPIYYNLIDNKFSRKFVYFLVPYVIIVVMAGSVYSDHNQYFPKQRAEAKLSHIYYDDQRNNDEEIIFAASIPSKYQSSGYLELFINYNSRKHDKTLEKICPDLTPLISTGLKTDAVNISFSIEKPISPDSVLACINQIFKVHISDTLFQNPEFHFYEHPAHGEKGVLTVMDIDFLKRGKHSLKIEHRLVKKDSLIWETWAEFPFWKE